MTAWLAHVDKGRVTKVEGVETFYLDLGRGHPLLLIHGWGSSSFSWRKNYPVLSSVFRVVAVDLPGFGMSSRLPSGFHLDTVSSHLFHFLETLGIDRVSLIGHSMGGAIASHMAAQQPEKVSKLVLVSPSLLGEGSGKRPFFVELARNKFVGKVLARVMLNRYFVRRALKNAYSNPGLVDEEMVEGYFQSVVRSGPVLLDAFNIMREFNLSVMEKIECDILFVLGEKDSWVPADGNRAIAERTGAKLVVIPDAGHSPHEEKHEQVNNIIITFLQSSM